MEPTEIPVLTKVVHKGKSTPVVNDELIQQLKQALLPDIMAQVERHLNEQSQQAAHNQQVLSQARMGEHIQRIEEAFIEAMQQRSQLLVQSLEQQVTHLGSKQQAQELALQKHLEAVQQQQIQAFESKLAALSETQLNWLSDTEQALRERLTQAQQEWQSQTLTPWLSNQYAEMEANTVQWRLQWEQALTEHMQQWQTQTLAAATQGWLAETQVSLQQAVEELRAEALETFTQQLKQQAEGDFLQHLDDKVAALVAQQLPEVQGEMQKRLKALILEVLQGIKFVMPPL